MKLVIGIPSAGNPAKPFLDSLQTLQLPASVTEIKNKSVTGNFVPAERELIVEFALEMKADFLFMVDDDMILPPDAIEQLLRPFADPLVALAGALYYSRDGLRPMAVHEWNPVNTSSAAIPAFDDATPVVVDGVGFGAVLLRTAALLPMSRPFFASQIFLERKAARVRVCNEDFLFCKRLRDAGWKVVLHPGVRVGHFDRSSKTVFPKIWEDSNTTNVRRMMVVQPDGTIGMQPFDGQVAQAREEHQTAALDYIFID